MARAIVLYAADEDAEYSNYRQISSGQLFSLNGYESKSVNVYDALHDYEEVGDSVEYINGELSNVPNVRSTWEVECEPFLYTIAPEEKQDIGDLIELRQLLSKRYLWVTFWGIEGSSGSAAPSQAVPIEHTWLLPVVCTGHKVSANRQKGIRTFSFTLKHRWLNDAKLEGVGWM